MRQHFHRCPNLRLVELDVREVAATRGRGHVVLDELCAAKKLAPCVGLVECDVLAPAQKRELLAVRVTRLRAEEGAPVSPLGDVPDPRRQELAELAARLGDERREITEENRRLLAEAAAAADWGGTWPQRATEGFASAGVVSWLDESLRALRSARLDAIDRALEALARGDRFACLRCQRPIALARLFEASDTHVCEACAREAARPEPDQDAIQETVAK
jgi:RNA polymerase-binding transcription factor DksA